MVCLRCGAWGACLIDIIEKDDALGFDDISNNTNDYNGKSFLNTDESITNELNSNKKIKCEYVFYHFDYKRSSNTASFGKINPINIEFS